MNKEIEQFIQNEIKLLRLDKIEAIKRKDKIMQEYARGRREELSRIRSFLLRRETDNNSFLGLLDEVRSFPNNFFTEYYDYQKEETLKYYFEQGSLNLSGEDAISELKIMIENYKEWCKSKEA